MYEEKEKEQVQQVEAQEPKKGINFVEQLKKRPPLEVAALALDAVVAVWILVKLFSGNLLSFAVVRLALIAYGAYSLWCNKRRIGAATALFGASWHLIDWICGITIAVAGVRKALGNLNNAGAGLGDAFSQVMSNVEQASTRSIVNGILTKALPMMLIMGACAIVNAVIFVAAKKENKEENSNKVDAFICKKPVVIAALVVAVIASLLPAITSAIPSGVGQGLQLGVKDYVLGDTAELENFSVTVLNVDATPEIDGYEADAGEEFFFVGFEVTNLTAENQSFDNDLITFYADGNQCLQTIMWYDEYYDYEGLDYSATLAGAKKGKYYVVGKIPERWGKVEVYFGEKARYTFSHIDLGGMSSTQLTDDQTGPAEYYLGDTMKYSGLQLTVDKVYTTTYLDAGYYSYYSPDEGKEFVFVFMDVHNPNTQPRTFNYFSLDPFADDYSVNYTTFLYDHYGSEELDDHTDIYPGKSMYGYLTLEVPIGWQKIELVTRQGTLVITADQAQPQ